MVHDLSILAASAAQSAGKGAGADPTALRQYQWHNRLILIFAPSPTDVHYTEQRASLNELGKAQLAERDLMVFSCFTASGILEDYTREPKQHVFGAAGAASLRSTFSVATHEFQVVLLGKDGGEKRRSDAPVAGTDLILQIDRMPMRQQELRDRSG